MSRRVSQSLPRSFLLLCAALLCLGVIWVPRAESRGFTFTKIVDSGTAMPGGGGSFALFGGPASDGNIVTFVGRGACFCFREFGVYAAAGGSLQKVADSSTPIPGGAGNFPFFGDVAVQGGTVAFHGANEVSQGIYASAGGLLTKVADTNTLIPHPGVPSETGVKSMLEETEAAARALGLQLRYVEARGPDDFARALAAMSRERVDGLILIASPMFLSEREGLP